MVVTSQEAIEDHGLTAVQNKASAKYDARDFDAAGRIRVFTDDL